MRKPTIILVLSLISIFFIFDLDSYLSFQNLKSSLEQFKTWRIDSPVLTGVIFFIIYIAVTGLSLPGAAVMTLAAGALFGLLWGTIIVSFASSIGATLAFLVSRFLFRDAIQKRFGERLHTINEWYSERWQILSIYSSPRANIPFFLLLIF